ncbi:MAG: hypothetical protein PHG95_00315 [Patescibacteria group bacterium]|nr:hypothetical protein [Patescibacteria group bacterium]
MSSKKYRKSLKRHYYAINNSWENEQKVKRFIEKELPDFSVTFPEIKSLPIKLGKLFFATIKIGYDHAQTQRLCYATIPIPMGTEISFNHEFAKLKINKKQRLITAPPVGSKLLVTPVFMVFYPMNFLGSTMCPMKQFNWYGREKIIVSEISACPPNICDRIYTPVCLPENMIIAGNLIGRELDGIDCL